MHAEKPLTFRTMACPRALLLFFLLAMSFFVQAASGGEKRIALVIGNAAYKESPLNNPVNDADDISAALKETGFEVIKLTNATQKDMLRAINRFGERLTTGTVALFFYAGHGVQVRGKNYLIPVDAEIGSENAVRTESVDVDMVLDQLSVSDLNVVILDACRNNPFERKYRSINGGLAQMDAPKGSLIAYATSPGKTALDGGGRNGLYTQELLKQIRQPNLPVESIFKNVRRNVAQATRDQQIPWESSSLTGDFYFMRQAQTASAPEARPAASPVIAAPVRPAPPAQSSGDSATVTAAAGGPERTPAEKPAENEKPAANNKEPAPAKPVEAASAPPAREPKPAEPQLALATPRPAAGTAPAVPAPAPAAAPPAHAAPAVAPVTDTVIKVQGQTMTGAFTQDPKSGTLSGSGKITWANGDRFEGTLKNGLREGDGEFVWANGQRYKGEWHNNVPNGNGVMHFVNGNRYEGPFRDGQPQGKGIMVFADGGRYEGEVNGGLPHGQGQFTYPGGDVASGAWRAGKQHGAGRYTWKNGSFWEGEFMDGKQTANVRASQIAGNAPVDAATRTRELTQESAPSSGR